MKKDFSSLKRPKYPMPEFIDEALAKHKLYEKYESRPAYQQNDYIHWISSAKREETRQKRLLQMLDELKKGGKYMNMEYKGK
ncbi:YdeI/OmpD-associated family protein [Chitinophaga barathri]|uniref:YdeI/OmpD-associated family protein n=1 Tax=Chitinophaga barathri TaxID=1647451 RepID=A0A3N4M977_9BACT|nr:YdeI/OmpD-associated family protein [Chitinophaga barathri]RPD40061.1 hypothetical protein EG028_15495 [Chitinophaga barathri]